jgi:hypothetical protein
MLPAVAVRPLSVALRKWDSSRHTKAMADVTFTNEANKGERRWEMGCRAQRDAVDRKCGGERARLVLVCLKGQQFEAGEAVQVDLGDGQKKRAGQRPKWRVCWPGEKTELRWAVGRCSGLNLG